MLATAAALSLAFVLLVWIAYPVCMAAAAALLDRRLQSGGDQSSVSVVIATREDRAAILQRVQNCFDTSFGGSSLEVIVALDASRGGDGPGEFAGVDPRLRAVTGDAPGGKAATLNAGVRAAWGEVLIFADTHQRFHRAAIPRLAAALADRRFGAVSGRLVLAERPGERSLVEYYWRMERWLRRNEARVHSAVGVTGAIYALRRELWTPLPTGLILDDVYVPMRSVLAGYRVGFIDEARALETRTPEASHEYRRKVRTLTGVIQLCAWLPGVLVPFRNPIWLQFVYHKLLRLLTPYCLVVVAAAVGAAAFTLLRRHPIALAAVLAAAAAAFLLRPRLARRLRSALWQAGMLQAAVVAATFNGLTGRWDVWNRPR